MASQIFINGGNYFSYGGALLVQADDVNAPFSNTSAVFELPATTISVQYSENTSYPLTIDNSNYVNNKVPGIKTGTITATGPWKNDHFFTTLTGSGGHSFLDQAFGVRSDGQLAPWIANIVPYLSASGTTVAQYSGVFWDTFNLTATYGQTGQDLMWTYTLQGMIADPGNILNAPTISMPAVAGTIGAGVSTYGTTTVSGAALYPTSRASITLSNGMTFVPAPYTGLPATDRINAGYIPGPIQGSVVITQLDSFESYNSLPQTAGDYPFIFQIPDGSGSHTFTFNLACSYDADGASWAARDFGRGSFAYSLFATNSNTTTFPFSTSYA